jgi:hypothetical protein
VCSGGRRAAPPEDCAGARNYLERLDSHRQEMPIEDLALMVGAIQRFLDSGDNRKAMGNLAELHEALERVTVYQKFQTDRFDRREANRQIQTLWQGRRVQP